MPSETPKTEPDAAWVTAYVGLGANLGEARQSLLQAAEQLAGAEGIGELRLSPRYRTAPIESSGADYVNAGASLRTGLEPHAPLDGLPHRGQLHGREPPHRHAPRPLDLDRALCGT